MGKRNLLGGKEGQVQDYGRGKFGEQITVVGNVWSGVPIRK